MVADAAGVPAAEVGVASVAAVVPSSAAVGSCADLAVVDEDFVVEGSESLTVASCCSVADAA